MMLIQPLLALALAALQDPKPEAAKPPADDWKDFDRVVVIVNHDIITQRELKRQFERENANRAVKNPAEAQRRSNAILTEYVRHSLAHQAGQDLGASEEMVERIVKDKFDRLVERRGGIVEMSKTLQQSDTSPADVRKDLRENLYATTWIETVTGEGPGVATRRQHDRYVRPGMMQFHYNTAMKIQESYETLGGRAETYSLQLMVLDPDVHGGPQATELLARELRKRIVDGEDMGELVRKYSLDSEKDGMLRDIDAPTLQRNAPAIGTFAKGAQEGDVSDLIPVKDKTRTLIQLVRLIERKPSVKPELSSPRVQEALTKAVQKIGDEYRLSLEYETLFEAAYVWPKELREAKKR